MSNAVSHDQHATATVLRFPIRPPLSEPERLRRALADLDLAMREQAAAVAAWRGALHKLDGHVANLNRSVHAYRSNLGAAAAKVAELGDQARAAAIRIRD